MSAPFRNRNAHQARTAALRAMAHSKHVKRQVMPVVKRHEPLNDMLIVIAEIDSKTGGAIGPPTSWTYKVKNLVTGQFIDGVPVADTLRDPANTYRNFTNGDFVVLGWDGSGWEIMSPEPLFQKLVVDDGTTTITLDSVNQIASLDGGGGLTGYIDLANKKIYLTDGTCTVDLNLNDIATGDKTLKARTLDLAIITAGPDANGCYTVEKQTRDVACTST